MLPGVRATSFPLQSETAATDACAICEDIPEFHGAARREMLAGFHENAQNEHRESCSDPLAAISKSDNRQKRKRQVGAKVHHFVIDAQTADAHDDRGGGGQ